MPYLRILGTTLVLAGSGLLTRPAPAQTAPQPIVVPVM
jgi:hypothetical protein